MAKRKETKGQTEI